MSLTARQVSQCTVDTGSGAVSVTAETIETMEAGTGSGGVTLQAGQLGAFTAEVGSGDVTLTAGAVDQAAVSAGSGGFTLTADQAPGALSVDLTSGPIHLTLPEEASFTATLDTVSGQWHCQLPAAQQGGPLCLRDRGRDLPLLHHFWGCDHSGLVISKPGAS